MGKYGSMDEPYPCALRAELRALLEILRHTAGNLIVHVDNKEVVDGVAQGRQWCCEAKRAGPTSGAAFGIHLMTWLAYRS